MFLSKKKASFWFAEKVGCGKTTLLRLLEGLYEPTEGTLEWKSPNTEWDEVRLSVAEQETFLFPKTVRENITKVIKKRTGALLLGLLLPGFAALLSQEFSARLGERIVEQVMQKSSIGMLLLVVAAGLGSIVLAEFLWGIGKTFLNRISTSLECELKELIYMISFME